jgi:hypothetical protein
MIHARRRGGFAPAACAGKAGSGRQSEIGGQTRCRMRLAMDFAMIQPMLYCWNTVEGMGFN